MNNNSPERAIETFINQLYALLAGGGMGSVFFRDDVDHLGCFQVLSAFFVTAVVISYWWDWVSQIKGVAVENGLEIFIDLLIMFVFILMFAYYKEPQWLARLLVVLSLLDLSWVCNKIFREMEPMMVSNQRWLIRKFAAIVIFVLSCGLLYLSSWPSWAELSIVIAAFTLVRCTCFVRGDDAWPRWWRTTTARAEPRT